MGSRSVLVTGGAGFIGRHTIPYLIERGFDVHIITHKGRSSQEQESLRKGSKEPVFFHSADLHDTDTVTPVLQKIRATHLLHFAWDARHGVFWNSSENLDWIVSSKLLVTAFIEAGGERIVAAGTCAEYDWGTSDQWLDERTTAVKPFSLYGQCKYAFRKSLFTVAEHHKLSAAWGRVFFLFGPHEGPKRLVSSAILSLLQAQAFEASQGDQVRDFLHVDDVAKAFVALLDSKVSGDVNIASGQESSVAEVLTILGRLTGRPDLIRLGAKPKQSNEPPRLVASVRRLREEVGVSFSGSLEERLAETVEWWRARKSDIASMHKDTRAD
jgi:nucleoside-diphosphate-sugar epimerase